MTSQTDGLAQDLDYALDIARQGQSSPLLGGPIGLMWALLATAALVVHGLALMEVLPIARPQIGLIWAVYGFLGTALSVVIGRRIERKAGARSFANKVAEASWTAMGIMIATVAISAVVGHVSLGLPFIVFDMIVPFAFALSAVANSVLARITGYGYLKFAAIASGVLTSVTLLMAGQAEMYLVAALGLCLSGVIPSWIEVRRETANVG